MNTIEIEAVLKEEIHRIAPDIDVTTIDRDANLQEEFDIDSMDFLHLVTALSSRFNIDMPQADYPRMMTYNAMTAYLNEHAWSH
ncbi:MAG: hypothetical protein K9G33_01175 [Sneathiella sp.]|nr:hypothetical protein [Sneathiella sp.]